MSLRRALGDDEIIRCANRIWEATWLGNLDDAFSIQRILIKKGGKIVDSGGCVT